MVVLLQGCDAVLTLRGKTRTGSWLRTAAKAAGVPIFSIKTSNPDHLVGSFCLERLHAESSAQTVTPFCGDRLSFAAVLVHNKCLNKWQRQVVSQLLVLFHLTSAVIALPVCGGYHKQVHCIIRLATMVVNACLQHVHVVHAADGGEY